MTEIKLSESQFREIVLSKLFALEAHAEMMREIVLRILANTENKDVVELGKHFDERLAAFRKASQKSLTDLI